MGPGPRPQIPHFAHVTSPCYISNFRPRKLGSPLTKSWIRTCLVCERKMSLKEKGGIETGDQLIIQIFFKHQFVFMNQIVDRKQSPL